MYKGASGETAVTVVVVGVKPGGTGDSKGPSVGSAEHSGQSKVVMLDDFSTAESYSRSVDGGGLREVISTQRSLWSNPYERSRATAWDVISFELRRLLLLVSTGATTPHLPGGR